MSSTPTPPAADVKPWAEMSRLERLAAVVAGLVVGAFVLAIAGFILTGAVVSTHDAFAAGPPSRLCGDGVLRHCRTRIPATVQSVQNTYFTVATDRAPYIRQVSVSQGPIPPVGTRVALEEWKGDVISIVDPVHGRRHTGNWPKRGDKVGTAIVFDFFLLLGLGAFAGSWMNIRNDRRASAALAGVTEQPAQTS